MEAGPELQAEEKPGLLALTKMNLRLLAVRQTAAAQKGRRYSESRECC